MNVKNMATNIKTNLGDRSTGMIGSESVDTVVKRAINDAITHIAVQASPDRFNRFAEIKLIPSKNEYALPTQDLDGNQIQIKNILVAQLIDSDKNQLDFAQLMLSNFIQNTDYLRDEVGVPRYFALWGELNKVLIDEFPDQEYTLKLYVEIFPPLVSSIDSTEELPFDRQWESAVEAYATAYCYLKLQQTQMYAIWTDLFVKHKAVASTTDREKHANPMLSHSPPAVTDPVLNPFINRWN